VIYLKNESFILEKINTISAPKYLHLTITNFCNWDCLFCSVHSKKSKYYETNTILKILDKIAEANVIEVNLYGGEPTLHPDFVKIGKYAKDIGLSVGFLSNGTNISEKNIDKIVDIFDVGTISIHGFKKTHETITNTKGSYESAMNTIQLLDNYGFKYGIATTVCTLNLFEFSNFIKYLYFKYPCSKLFVINRASYSGQGEQFCLNKGEIIELVEQVDFLHRRFGINIKLGVPTPPELLPPNLRKYASFCSAGTDYGNINGKGEIKLCYSLGASTVF